MTAGPTREQLAATVLEHANLIARVEPTASWVEEGRNLEWQIRFGLFNWESRAHDYLTSARAVLWIYQQKMEGKLS